MIDISHLPQRPGCYIFRDARRRALYVGKALNLKHRVSSYFHSGNPGPRIQRMLQHARSIDTLVTHNEIEAFLLENTLIKKHQPRYNVNLKDAKTYAWLRITSEGFPRIITARGTEGKGQYFGPFVSGQARNEIRTALNNIFGLRTCRRMPRRPCLRFQLGTCCAPCTGEISTEAYAQRVQDARQVLNGDVAELIRRLESRMREASGSLRFEYALQLRERISALRRILERQQVQKARKTEADIIHFLEHGGRTFLMRFGIRRGVLENKEEFIFEAGGDVLEEFIPRYYAERPVPREIILPMPLSPGMETWLRHRRNGAVTITRPQRGDKRRLLDLVATNLQTTFMGDHDTLAELKELLDLDRIPFSIECFDVSHLQGKAMVASMVRFENGRPEPGSYRRFRLRTVRGINDPAAIAEVVQRRYHRLINENSSLPDLVVVDGGATQRNAVESSMRDLGLRIPVIGLAKREETIFTAHRKDPLLLDRRRPALRLLQRLRDESHRFALAYHRLLRSREAIS